MSDSDTTDTDSESQHSEVSEPEYVYDLPIDTICYMCNGSHVPCSFTDRLTNCSENAETSLASLHTAVISGDMGRVVDLKKERKLTDYEKYHILTKHFTPDSTY